MKIDWNHVTGISQITAIVLFVCVFGLGFYLGTLYQMRSFENALQAELDQMVYDFQAAEAASAPTSGE